VSENQDVGKFFLLSYSNLSYPISYYRWQTRLKIQFQRIFIPTLCSHDSQRVRVLNMRNLIQNDLFEIEQKRSWRWLGTLHTHKKNLMYGANLSMFQGMRICREGRNREKGWFMVLFCTMISSWDWSILLFCVSGRWTYHIMNTGCSFLQVVIYQCLVSFKTVLYAVYSSFFSHN